MVTNTGKFRLGQRFFIIKCTLGILLILLIFLFSSADAKAQTTDGFYIENSGDYDVNLLRSAFQKPHWDSFRKMNETQVINFENGAKVTLFSAQHLIDNGIPVDTSKLLADNLPDVPGREFALSPTGNVMEKRKISPTSVK